MEALTYSQQVAEEVRVLLARRSLTRGWLAREIGMGESTLSGKLTGRTSLHIGEVVAIATALDIDVRDIMPPLVHGGAA